MSLADLMESNNTYLGYAPAAADPEDMLGAAQQIAIESFYNFSSDSRSTTYDRGYDFQAERYEAETGKVFNDLVSPEELHQARRDGVYNLNWLRETQQRKLDEERAKGEHDFSSIPTNDEILAWGKEIAVGERQYTDAMREVSDVGLGTELLGGVAASFFDPINLATIPFGAGAGGTLLRAVAVEAGINVAVEAVVQKNIYDWQNELGQDYTMEDVLLGLAVAGGFGALVGGAVRVPKSIKSKIAEYAEKNGLKAKADVKEAIENIQESQHVETHNIAKDETTHIENAESAQFDVANGQKINDAAIEVDIVDIAFDGVDDSGARYLNYENKNVFEVLGGALKERLDKITKSISTIEKQYKNIDKADSELKVINNQIDAVESHIGMLKDQIKRIKENRKYRHPNKKELRRINEIQSEIINTNAIKKGLQEEADDIADISYKRADKDTVIKMKSDEAEKIKAQLKNIDKGKDVDLEGIEVKTNGATKIPAKTKVKETPIAQALRAMRKTSPVKKGDNVVAREQRAFEEHSEEVVTFEKTRMESDDIDMDSMAELKDFLDNNKDFMYHGKDTVLGAAQLNEIMDEAISMHNALTVCGAGKK